MHSVEARRDVFAKDVVGMLLPYGLNLGFVRLLSLEEDYSYFRALNYGLLEGLYIV